MSNTCPTFLREDNSTVGGNIKPKEALEKLRTYETIALELASME